MVYEDWRQLEPTFFKVRVQDSKKKTSRTTSAYALFFRERQVAEKRRAPHQTFGQLSQNIAAQWEHLTAEEKNQYKLRCESKKRCNIEKAVEERAKMLLGVIKK
ncbi:unnamed protein product [Caenorhabditis angaria]|uniref:HMG box domain-containing protein n=1 Tax=Caenorhabditis angaria TaxID=860376 RepID=A0A9P1MTG1_9PELO|nr:unnamed protein product [Caenorhabditis angaria]